MDPKVKQVETISELERLGQEIQKAIARLDEIETGLCDHRSSQKRDQEGDSDATSYSTILATDLLP